MNLPPRAVARAAFDAAVMAARPDRLMRGFDWGALPRGLVPDQGPVRFVGMGKASIPFAVAVGSRFSDRLEDGLAVVPHGYAGRLPDGLNRPAGVAVLEAGHPVPDAAGVAAARRVLRCVDTVAQDALLILGISGGGSALVPAFPVGVGLGSVRKLTGLLVRSGAPIDEINAVRGALSLVAGGRLAARAPAARVLGLVLSDVPGNDLRVVAGGPTIPAATTGADALRVLDRHGLTDRVPEGVLSLLRKGGVPVPPATGAHTVLVGTNRDALAAAARSAHRSGYAPTIVTSAMRGEAWDVARAVVAELRSAAGRGPRCLLWGGETTVTVRRRGTGGRNQELALAAAIAMEEGREAASSVTNGRRARVDPPAADGIEGLLAAGTDGCDGPTYAAGAWADPRTLGRAAALGLDARTALSGNDSHPFFSALTDLVVTGPTHTNVMDLVVGLVR